jgi:hypothetical protein
MEQNSGTEKRLFISGLGLFHTTSTAARRPMVLALASAFDLGRQEGGHHAEKMAKSDR